MMPKILTLLTGVITAISALLTLLTTIREFDGTHRARTRKGRVSGYRKLRKL